jgi:hypothetical protein
MQFLEPIPNSIWISFEIKNYTKYPFVLLHHNDTTLQLILPHQVNYKGQHYNH